MSRNLIARISVAAVAIPCILWISYQGGWWLFGLVALFAVIGLLEFLFNEGRGPGSPVFWIAIVAVGAIFYRLSALVTSNSDRFSPTPESFASEVLLVLIGFALLSGMALAVRGDKPSELFSQLTRSLWAVIYVGGLYPFVFLLGTVPRLPYPDAFTGGDCLLFLFGLLWVGDTAAMGIGSWIGKRRLAPTVSPNKTVEGFIGGLLGAAVIGIVMMFWKFSGLAWHHVILIALGSSLFGQLGDLVESMWKRSLGIKDSSAVIPGHGGVLDRFDSLLFAAPFMYLYLRLFIVE